MARLIFRLNQSLDGYVDLQKLRPPGPDASRHFIDLARNETGSVYGCRMYEVMRYWDNDQSEWGAEELEFASIWRQQKKWVVSRTLTAVGSNATLLTEPVDVWAQRLKTAFDGDISVSGPELAGSLSALNLIDVYQLYIQPVVLGSGKPFFSGPRPPLKFVSSDLIGEGVIRLTYVPE